MSVLRRTVGLKREAGVLRKTVGLKRECPEKDSRFKTYGRFKTLVSFLRRTGF